MERNCSEEVRAIEPCLAPDALTARAEVVPAAGRKPYTGPQLTVHGRVPAITLVIGSPSTDDSDRNLKERFAPVDPRAILARVATLPIETWSYKGEPVRHLGPMAQDFAATFGLGADDRHIFPLDAAGIALAALQGLHALVQAQDVGLQALERELFTLRAGQDSPSTQFQPSEEAGMDQTREDATSLTRSEPDVPTAGNGTQTWERPRKAYGRPGLTAYGRVPALTLGQTSPGQDGSAPSDRTLKEEFAPVDPRAILARVAVLPIETWSYKGERARHLGPMAQDFAAAFGLGADDRHIFPLDAAGIALAALQGLRALVQAQDARLESLERELTALRAPRTRARQAYGRPSLTAYGRVPTVTLAQGSVTQDSDPA